MATLEVGPTAHLCCHLLTRQAWKLAVTLKEEEQIAIGDDITIGVVKLMQGWFESGSQLALRSGSSGTMSSRGQSRCDYGVDLAFCSNVG